MNQRYQDHALEQLRKLAKKDDPDETFTITNKNRKEELEELIQASSLKLPLFAWGENRVLKRYAEDLLSDYPHHIGLPRSYPWFRHASPLLKTEKIRWLKDIIKLLK